MSGISKRVSGSWVSGDYGIMKTATDTLTTLPDDIYANDTTATVGLKGNMVQNGTPTPQNPIQPSECGDRTGNLFDISSTISGKLLNSGNGELIDNSNYLTSDYKLLSAGVYTLSMINEYTGTGTTTNRLAVYDLNKTFISFKVDVTGARPSTPIYTFALATDCYIRISVRITDTSVMLNSGSTPLPYEPYGIKIPISSASTTTNIYLGEVETTRNVKKLVFDGTENWTINQSGTENAYFSMSTGLSVKSSTQQICTHFVWGDVSSSSTTKGIYMTQSGVVRVRENEPSASDLTSFESFLQQQYTAGTPVCVWYVLATEETGIVNEPLMKIGDYADEVSGITIPTIAGADTLSVGTTLQPSEVTVNYHGWHDVQSVHERENGAWTE